MSLAGSEVNAPAGHPNLRLMASKGNFGFARRRPQHFLAEATAAVFQHGADLAGQTWKRALDLVVASALLLATLPIILLLAVAIWSIDRRNPFYAQLRVGRHGVPFRVWKLRSMHCDADIRLAQYLRQDARAAVEWQRNFKLSQDPRVLPRIGNFIRRTSLDELPQFWNIMRGEMSLVGPRPFPAYHLDCFSEEFRQLRSSVLPGLTGLWQIQSRSDGDLSDQERYDSYYLQHRSLRLDLSILVRTLPAVLSARGAR